MNETVIDKELAKMVFGDNEEMYKKYLFQLADRDLFGQVERFLAEGDIPHAFETAHTMKGLIQNLALVHFSQTIEKLVEIMRDGGAPTQEQMDASREEYKEILTYLEEIRENNMPIFG